jgi:LPS-assembly protein
MDLKAHPLRLRHLIVRLVLVTGLLFAVQVHDPIYADETPLLEQPDPWHIDADQIDYNQEKDEYLARGNVSIMRKGRTLTADMVRWSQGTQNAVAQGNVRLVYGDNVLSGRQLELNLESETGTLVDGTVFISPNHLYLSGKSIRKTGAQTFAAHQARITSCDGPDPDWKITGRDLTVTIEGYGFAKHTTLWAGKVPVLYSPFLVFPVKLKRQSGLLMPELGHSDRKGTEYLQPFFWAINESSDATVYAHSMSERGVRTGLEYRYIVDRNTMGAIFLEGFTDRRIDDGQGEASERWGYTGDDDLRTNDDRYWFRMKHDQEIGLGLTARLDIDIVSDQDYLTEFKSNYNGFNDTQAYFEKTYGRQLDDYNDAVRLNRLNLNRTWDQYVFNADLRWYDDVVKRNEGGEDDTLQQLPVVTVDGVKQVLGDSPLYYDLTTSYTHYYRIDGTRGQRMDLYPRGYYPFDLFNGVSVEPSVGLRQTAWHIDHYDSEPEHGDDNLYRAIYDLKVDASTEFFRIYDFGIAGSDRLKHAVIPEIVYEFTPEQDQDDFPVFDELDRIERKNLVTYGITNTLIARTPKQSAADDAMATYTPFLRFELNQSYDINEQDEEDPKPFSNISAELDITPGRYVRIDADAQWSVYDDRLETLNNALTLWNSAGDRLSIDYRYTRESSDTADDGIESVSADGVLAVAEQWKLRAGHEHNLYDDQAIESGIGISYQSQCWGVDFDYSVEYNDDTDNHKFTIQFNLLGLGSIGK